MSDLQSHVSACFLVYLFPCLSAYQSTNLPIYQSTRLPIYPSTNLPVYQSTTSQIFCPRNRRLLVTTKTLLNAIAPAASIGLR